MVQPFYFAQRFFLKQNYILLLLDETIFYYQIKSRSIYRNYEQGYFCLKIQLIDPSHKAEDKTWKECPPSTPNVNVTANPALPRMGTISDFLLVLFFQILAPSLCSEGIAVHCRHFFLNIFNITLKSLVTIIGIMYILNHKRHTGIFLSLL